MTQFSGRSRFLATLVAGIAFSAPLQAQEAALFSWSGRVDRRVELTAQGSNTSASARRGQEYQGRFRMVAPLPQEEGTVRVVVTSGRGEATVVEQPSANNNYRTVVRITDRSGGADRYQLTAYFTPTANARDGRRRRGGMGRRDRGNDQPAVLHWSGEVDADAEVRWQGASITQQATNGNPLRNVRSSVETVRNRVMGATGMTATGTSANDAVTVSVRGGRGSVDIVQQPSQSNNWTTVVRIRDPQSGYGRYSFDLTRP